MHEHELMKYPVARGQVLMVCTSCDHVGDRHDTGVWWVARPGCWVLGVCVSYVCLFVSICVCMCVCGGGGGWGVVARAGARHSRGV